MTLGKPDVTNFCVTLIKEQKEQAKFYNKCSSLMLSTWSLVSVRQICMIRIHNRDGVHPWFLWSSCRFRFWNDWVSVRPALLAFHHFLRSLLLPFSRINNTTVSSLFVLQRSISTGHGTDDIINQRQNRINVRLNHQLDPCRIQAFHNFYEFVCFHFHG